MLSANKLAAFIAAVTAPLLTLLVDQNLLSAMFATDIGTVVATAIVFLHVNNDEARQAIAAARPVAPKDSPDPATAAPTAATQPAPLTATAVDVLAANPAVPSAL